MQTDIQLKADLKFFIASTGYTEADKIHDDTFLFEEGILESIGVVHLITFLEEKFNITVTDNDLMESNFVSINAIASFITSKSKV